MSLSELSSVYSLFVSGLVVGSALCTIPFVIGYAISSVYRIIKSA